VTDSPAGVRVQRAGPIAEIALSNGPLNLVTKDLLRAFNHALGAVSYDSQIRCVIVHGGDARAFCAGSDIREFADLRHDAIDGPALGGGLEIALACDLRVCRRGVALGLPESSLGGLAGSGSVRLARLIGPARAKELLFTGETIATDKALAWGIVNIVVEEGSALDGARRLAATIAKRGPLSNRFSKQLVDAAQDLPNDAALSMSTVLQQQIYDSSDLREGMSAFFAKREPDFLGR